MCDIEWWCGPFYKVCQVYYQTKITTYRLNNKVLLYSIGNYVQYPIIKHNWKRIWKRIIHIHITESLYCTAEISTTLQINETSIKVISQMNAAYKILLMSLSPIRTTVAPLTRRRSDLAQPQGVGSMEEWLPNTDQTPGQTPHLRTQAFSMWKSS